MKSEKEQLSEFVALAFGISDSEENDIFSKKLLMKSSLTSVRIVAQGTLEVCSCMRDFKQKELSSKMETLGLPSLDLLQNKSFKEFIKIVNRGKIRTEHEWRLVRSLSETSVLKEEYQTMAYKLIENYEQQRV